METLVERGCGLDVHQATVVACLLIVRRDGKVQKQVRTFGTTTRELLSMREWLLLQGCTHVAMESTGVYWKPVYAILEGAFQIVVANAQHVKKVPGRKTDVKDAEWIADLVCHGLLRQSFVPPKPIRELRDLTRYRRKLEEHIQEKLEPYAAQLALLDEIPGVDWTRAAVIIAELGVDMSVFQSVSQLASWAGVCPGNNKSAGKRKSSRIPKGNVYLKTALVEAAHAAARTKGSLSMAPPKGGVHLDP